MLSMLYLQFIPPIIPMIFVGFAYSMVAASLWPCIPLIVKSNALGTAYGLFFAIQNIGLFIGPLLIGHITSTGYYTTMMLTFAECAFLAGALTVSVAVCDLLTTRSINISAKQMRLRNELLNATKEQEKLGLVNKTGSVNNVDDYDRFHLQDDYD